MEIPVTNNLKIEIEPFTQEELENLKTAGKYVLAALSGLAVLGVAVVAPNALQILGLRHRDAKSKNRKMSPLFVEHQRKKVKRTLFYLRSKGYISIAPTNHEWLVKFSEKGAQYLRKVKNETLVITQQEKWDNKWWFVLADIPTKSHERAAQMLRKRLKQLGFFALQRTVWVYPYNPISEINKISNQYNIGKFVTIAEVSRLENEDSIKLKSFFNL
ncbi:MAG TPA: hypothetical protein VEA59_03810 [Patescibacteria group bacterium]|nr:hypothetical protein [Patescibacteria group bacterium]